MDYKYITRFCADAKVVDADDDVKKEAFASLIDPATATTSYPCVCIADFNP